MRRLVYTIMAALLLASAVYLVRSLVMGGEMLLLALLAPAIIAAMAFAVMLLVRVLHRHNPETPD